MQRVRSAVLAATDTSDQSGAEGPSSSQALHQYIRNTERARPLGRRRQLHASCNQYGQQFKWLTCKVLLAPERSLPQCPHSGIPTSQDTAGPHACQAAWHCQLTLLELVRSHKSSSHSLRSPAGCWVSSPGAVHWRCECTSSHAIPARNRYLSGSPDTRSSMRVAVQAYLACCSHAQLAKVASITA